MSSSTKFCEYPFLTMRSRSATLSSSDKKGMNSYRKEAKATRGWWTPKVERGDAQTVCTLLTRSRNNYMYNAMRLVI